MAMRRRRLVFGAVTSILVLSAVAYVAAGLHVYAQYRATQRAYSLACDNLLVWTPPATLYTGMYPNQASLVNVRVQAPRVERVTLTATVVGVTQPQTVVRQIGPTFQNIALKPILVSDSNLESLIGPGQKTTQLSITLQSAGREICGATAPITVFSRQWIQWRDPLTQADLTPYVGGWVTPHATVIAELVGRAAQRIADHPELYDDVPALYGYNQGAATKRQVRDQVDAIFDTMVNEYHLRYASDNIATTSSQAQLVQLPRDILGTQRPTGMCVETTVILASAVERLGMRPFVVFTSTHAFLGVALTDHSQSDIEYWETSDLNSGVLGAQANVDGNLEFASDQVNHAIRDVIDVEYQRARGIEPME